MKKFILTHTHKYGVTTYVFHSNSELDQLNDNLDSVCIQLNIDFDSEDETITMEEFPTEIQTVIL